MTEYSENLTRGSANLEGSTATMTVGRVTVPELPTSQKGGVAVPL